MIVLISDLLVDREPLLKGLEMLRQRRHDILVFHVLDEDEMTFPFAGTTRFEGMEELPHLLCDPRALRDGYLEALEEYLVEVRRGCTRMGIDYQLVRTGDYLDAVLSKFLHHRMDDARPRRRRGRAGRSKWRAASVSRLVASLHRRHVPRRWLYQPASPAAGT